LRIEAYHWKQKQPLAEHYSHDFQRVKELFEYNPWDASSLEQRAEWLDKQPGFAANRANLADVLRQYNEKAGNAPEAMAAIDALREDKTLAVVGGQQAGLFTGPLYVVHKAITLLQTARKASARLGRPVVPVFWIAGEDHDFDEVNHTYFLSQQPDVQKIKIDHPTGRRTSVSRLAISADAWEDALRQLGDSLMDTEFKPGLMEKLRRISESSNTLVDFFAGVMAWLFGSHGLVLMDSNDANLRRLEAPMFARMISEQSRMNDGFLAGRRDIERLGYAPQAEVNEESANLFVVHDGERTLLQRREDGFSDKKGELLFSERELLHIAETSPELLSNNVMTRPLMQEYLFPVLCTVLGPGEIAYWALTRQAFHALGMRMPILVPRLEFTLLEGTLQKHMDKYGLSFDDVVERYDQKKKAWLDAQDTLRLEEHFTDVKARFKDMYHPILETIAGINPGMRKLGDTNLQKILEQIDFLENRSTDAFHAQFDASLRQLERIRLTIAPLGKPQERVYNIFTYLNKYADGWLHELIDTPVEANGVHRIGYF
jgi:bacillithiol biosynthesis cysteine-adding enzyme BshC